MCNISTDFLFCIPYVVTKTELFSIRYSNKYNLTFNDADSAQAVIEDVKLFYTFGGRTIVENSSHGLNRNIPLMVKISEQTGVNILAGTGIVILLYCQYYFLFLIIQNTLNYLIYF